MKKLSTRITLAIIICTLATSMAIGSFTYYNSYGYIQIEAEQKLGVTTLSQAHMLSQQFVKTEATVNFLHSYITATLNPDRIQTDADYLSAYEAELDRVLKQSVEEESWFHGIYFTFNPELTGEVHEVWYLDLEGDRSFQRVDNDLYNQFSTDSYSGDDEYPSITAFYPENPGMAYYYEAKASDTGLWYEPWDEPQLPITTLGFSRSVRIGETFAGVVGIDIDIEEIKKTTSKMKVGSLGYAFLITRDLSVISHPEIRERENLRDVGFEDHRLLSSFSPDNSHTVLKRIISGRPRLYGCARLSNGWVLVLAPDWKEIVQPLKDLTNAIAIITILLLLLAVLAARFISYRLSTPVETAASRMKALNIDLKAMVDEEVEKNRQKDAVLLYHSRLAKMGEMIAHIAHQWRQPLNNLSLILSNMKETYEDETQREEFDQALHRSGQIIQSMSQTIDDFRNFLNPHGIRESFSIQKSALFSVELMERSLKYDGIRVILELKKDPMIYGYANEFSQVVSNILNNARDALLSRSGNRREIIITIDEDESSAWMEIFNNGPPLSREVQKHLFKPYFTTKTNGMGTGIGLYMSKIIIEEHLDGSLTLENQGKGVLCRIALPRQAAEERNGTKSV